jgi:hypothetical protein
MEVALDAHRNYEQAFDLDGTMSTVAPHPVYEFVNLGWRVDGRDALREAYRRMFVGYLSKIQSKTLRTLAVAPNALCREGFAVVKSENGPINCRTITVITFEGDLVSGERAYTDAFTADLMYGALGADFAQIPGVSELN